MEIRQRTHPYVKIAELIAKCAPALLLALPALKDSSLMLEPARSAPPLLQTVSHAVMLTHVLDAKPDFILIQIINVLPVSAHVAHVQVPTNVLRAHKDFGFKEILANPVQMGARLAQMDQHASKQKVDSSLMQELLLHVYQIVPPVLMQFLVTHVP